MLRQTAEEVKRILVEYPETRDSDMKLCVQIAKERGVAGMTFEDVLLNLERLKMPNFETVRRTRQKIQAENPNLRASKEVQKYRAEKERKFYDFARWH